MGKDAVVLRFDKVSFEYAHKKPILDEASFSVRTGAKIVLMGQNGAGKSSLFKLITGELKSQGGRISLDNNAVVARARQVVPREELELTVLEFLGKYFRGRDYELPSEANSVLETVNLDVPVDRRVSKLSGGQQARLLLAQAIIQRPDILLLDEPTNNLDEVGIGYLLTFILGYEKTCLVISHDAEFLNSFAEGVVYLDVFTQKTETYTGDYFDVVEEIARRIDQARRENARIEKEITSRKEQANFFAQKGGKLRNVAKKMRDAIDELEENKIDARREDQTITEFRIEAPVVSGPIVEIKTVSIMKEGVPTVVPVNITLKKKERLLVSGPNGIGKTTFLESLASESHERAIVTPGVKVGFYRQDFSTLNFEGTAYDALKEVMEQGGDEDIRRIAARFFITGEFLMNTVASLSEGQKGLLSFARLVMQKPSLLILDEPTNHINFRHVPVIAKALDEYEGAMILVSHVPDFVGQIRIDQTLDLGSL